MKFYDLGFNNFYPLNNYDGVSPGRRLPALVLHLIYNLQEMDQEEFPDQVIQVACEQLLLIILEDQERSTPPWTDRECMDYAFAKVKLKLISKNLVFHHIFQSLY